MPRIVDFETAEDLANAIRKLDGTELKGNVVRLTDSPVGLFWFGLTFRMLRFNLRVDLGLVVRIVVADTVENDPMEERDQDMIVMAAAGDVVRLLLHLCQGVMVALVSVKFQLGILLGIESILPQEDEMKDTLPLLHVMDMERTIMRPLGGMKTVVQGGPPSMKAGAARNIEAISNQWPQISLCPLHLVFLLFLIYVSYEVPFLI
jgi:hypothetical protein